MSAQPDSAPGMKAGQVPEVSGMDERGVPASPEQKKRIVIVGLGMVGIAFMYVLLTIIGTATDLDVLERSF